MKRLIWPCITLVVGVVVAALVAAMPQATLDVLMWRLGLPYVLPAATPPIGVTGRTMLAILVLIAFVALAAIALRRRGYLIGVQRKPALASPDAALRVPTIRRADAHPDAAPRLPIRAEEDLGPPLPMATVTPAAARALARARTGEQTLPRNLDQPLAAFDPVAIPDVPRDPVRAVAPLAPPPPITPEPPVEKVAPPPVPSAMQTGLDAGAGDNDVAAMETPRRDMPGLMADAPEEEAEPTVATSTASAGDGDSLASLLDRLERGARQRKAPEPPPPPAPPAPPESLSDTLLMLRRMARR
ncbi:hypothetical protein LQ954_01895 [Sphingomonas sp. IC-11]|uniref:hypothetical protein n=1 Tax=Sphingomonas sp. IC-11 TaxID=2898528 RepID=UPI001E357E48|nr:hypothetical protein [Sphingomonas sp. IC-11]MCD2314896.1 hypothetical protein [Sphingomonas sp. IC-11]